MLQTEYWEWKKKMSKTNPCPQWSHYLLGDKFIDKELQSTKTLIFLFICEFY